MLATKRGDAATGPLSVTPLARALRAAGVAKQIDAEYDRLLQRLNETTLASTVRWVPVRPWLLGDPPSLFPHFLHSRLKANAAVRPS